MILVTGATGFIGRALLPKLAETGQEIRCLLRASKRSPRLAKGIPVQISIADVTDARALRPALAGVDTIIHLAGAEWRGRHGDLLRIDVNGTRTLVEAAREAGVSRFVYVSHLGADRASAFPVLKAKGIAEEFIRQSGIPYTILRSALVYGIEDIFVNVLGALIKLSPGMVLIPAGGTLLQPLWVDDLATCLEWSLGDDGLVNQTFSVGGPEFLSFQEMAHIIMDVLKTERYIFAVRPPFLRMGAWFFEQVLPRSPITSRWLDHLAVNRTCELTSATRHFGLKPVRFAQSINYLREKSWFAEMRRLIYDL